MVERISAGLEALGIPPPGAAATLSRYGELLIEKNKVMNLTAITEPDQVADLHFLDCAALLTIGGERAVSSGTSRSSTWGPARLSGTASAHSGALPLPHSPGQPRQAGHLAGGGVLRGWGWRTCAASTPGPRSRPFRRAGRTPLTSPPPELWPICGCCASCACPM